MSLSPEQFAAKTGASEGFITAHPKEWMMFRKQDVCENDEFPTCFPRLSLGEARRMWLALEEHFFARFDDFLRVWSEWGSSGIWSVPYPGSRSAGGMINYQHLPLPIDLVDRFRAWQQEYDEHEPWVPGKFDSDQHARVGDELARDLRVCVGPQVYVEHRELVVQACDSVPWPRSRRAARLEDSPLVLFAIEHDGPGPALKKQLKRAHKEPKSRHGKRRKRGVISGCAFYREEHCFGPPPPAP